MQAEASGNIGAIPRILIVDDEAFMCDLCTRTLQHADYEVVSTTDALFALQELKANGPFDLLLADIKMPVISGLDLARYAREVDPAIAIVIMTGHISTELLRQVAQRGVADFISKPFELAELRLAIGQALHKRSLLQDSLRLRALEQLLHSSEAINATLDCAQLSRIIVQITLQQTTCQAGFLLMEEEHMPGQLVVTEVTDTGWRLLEGGYTAAAQAFHEGQIRVVVSEKALCVNDAHQPISRGLIVPLPAQGNVVGVLVLCDDRPEKLRPGIQEMVALIANQAGTALRNAQLYGQLQETFQRLQELDRLKSEFIAIASHELRTPLSIVLGYTMMMRDKSEDDRREYAQRVLESAQRIKEIIDDMVNLRHLELGEVPLSVDRCMLHDIVSQAVERMLPAARARMQELALDLPAEVVTFLADREKILLVLGNLVSNAVKFTPEGGDIGINAALWTGAQVFAAMSNASVPIDTFGFRMDLPWVVFEVWDTGVGVPESEHVRIFERFYQVAASLTRQQGGTGLGLSIVRELTVLQGGVVWLESVPDKGSSFFFALPYHTE